MALINCTECNKEISDKALTCPGCGAPVVIVAAAVVNSPSKVSYNRGTDTFSGTKLLIVKLAMKAIQEIGWKLDQANENLGLVTFQTGVTWGSWSGVSCSLNIEEIKEHEFKVTGTGKQNLSGGQLIALNIGNEAQSKARKAIDMMKELAK
jgi:hypothetical protein